MKRYSIGDRFGSLVIVAIHAHTPGHNRRWDCLCDCGSVKTMWANNVAAGNTRSCGCKRGNFSLHPSGLDSATYRHGRSRTPEHKAWGGMRDRCLNPRNHAYANYGGRGITISERWASFESFLADMGLKPSPEHSLDRIDNDGNYEPGNCRWATSTQQAQNRRLPRRRVKTPEGVPAHGRT